MTVIIYYFLHINFLCLNWFEMASDETLGSCLHLNMTQLENKFMLFIASYNLTANVKVLSKNFPAKVPGNGLRILDCIWTEKYFIFCRTISNQLWKKIREINRYSLRYLHYKSKYLTEYLIIYRLNNQLKYRSN